MDISVHVFDKPLVWIGSSLVDDTAGVFRTRFVSSDVASQFLVVFFVSLYKKKISPASSFPGLGQNLGVYDGVFFFFYLMTQLPMKERGKYTTCCTVESFIFIGQDE